MIFCGECGKEIYGGNVFCVHCGGKAEEVETYSEPPASQQSSGVGEAASAMLKALKKSGSIGLGQLGVYSKHFIAVAALLVVNLILFYVPTMEGGVNYFSALTASVSLSMVLSLVGVGILDVLNLLSVIGAAVLFVLPLFAKRTYTTKHFIFLKISAIYSLSLSALFYFVFMYAASQVGRSWFGSVASAGLNFWGYLHLGTGIALVVMVFKLSAKIKASQYNIHPQPQP